MKKFKTRINVPETQQETVLVKVIKFIINKSSILRGLIFDEIYIKIQENIENYNSFDMVKPEESINNLNELINYETKALDEALKYYESYSQLIYFTNKGLK